MDNEVKLNVDLISYCGLYCRACRKYLKGKCPGCRENEKASWCKVRSCNKENGFHTCAACSTNVVDCRKYNNFVSKMFALIFRSDRKACIYRIKEVGEMQYVKEMSDKKAMTIKKK